MSVIELQGKGRKKCLQWSSVEKKKDELVAEDVGGKIQLKIQTR